MILHIDAGAARQPVFRLFDSQWQAHFTDLLPFRKGEELRVDPSARDHVGALGQNVSTFTYLT